VVTTAKSTPAGLTGKQEQTAAFFKQLAIAPTVTTPAKGEVKAVADCLVLEQDQEAKEQVSEAEKERLSGVLFGGK
jgi:hypothetical protein